MATRRATPGPLVWRYTSWALLLTMRSHYQHEPHFIEPLQLAMSDPVAGQAPASIKLGVHSNPGYRSGYKCHHTGAVP